MTTSADKLTSLYMVIATVSLILSSNEGLLEIIKDALIIFMNYLVILKNHN